MANQHASSEQVYTFKQIWENHYRVAIDALMKHDKTILPAMSLTIPCIDAAYQCDTGNRGPDDHYTGTDILTWLVSRRSYSISNLDKNDLIAYLAKYFSNWLKHNAFIGAGVVLHDFFLDGKQATVPVTVVFNENSGEISRVMVSPTQWWKMVKDIINQVYREKPNCTYQFS